MTTSLHNLREAILGIVAAKGWFDLSDIDKHAVARLALQDDTYKAGLVHDVKAALAELCAGPRPKLKFEPQTSRLPACWVKPRVGRWS